MGYTTREHMVRVDFFRERGKWYVTEAVAFDYGVHTDPGKLPEPEDAARWGPERLLARSLVAHLCRRGPDGKPIAGEPRLSEMWAICLEPYCPASFPQMMRVARAFELFPPETTDLSDVAGEHERIAAAASAAARVARQGD